MSAQAAEAVRHEEPAPRVSAEIAVLKPPRLPYHEAIGERFGIDRAGWKALVEAIFPAAKSADSVIMALSYCRARKLDPFKRPVHIVPMWSASVGAMVETVWPGISELRTTAFRTGQYAGKDETEFGPEVERTFKGTFKGETREITVSFPAWGRVRLTRILGGVERSFVSPKVYWLEAYAKWGNTDVPNDMWAKRPNGQLEKCVEAAGLRCAFPEEIGNDLAAEEMEGQRLLHDEAPAAIRAPVPPKPPKPPAPPAIEHKTPVPSDPVVKEMVAASPQALLRAPAPPTAAVEDAEVITPEDILADIEAKLGMAGTADALDKAWETLADDVSDLPMHLRQQAEALYERAGKRFEEGA